MPSLIHRATPGAIPSDVRDLLARFGFSLPKLLTTSNPKLNKGEALGHGRGLILHHLPARALARAITPGNDGTTAARGFLPSLLELAEREGLTAAALAHNGCPWMTAGCGSAEGGCLNFSGHGGLGSAVSAARGRRTLGMIWNPETYARAVLWSVARHYAAARLSGENLAVRLRGTDEGPNSSGGWHGMPVHITPGEALSLRERYGFETSPHAAAPITERLAANPGLTAYEYCKAPIGGPLGLIAQRAAGVDVTASFAADRLTACRDGLAALREGFRVAIPVAIKKGAPIPSSVAISAGGESITVPTVDGDLSDHRYRDPHGVAVILRTKLSRGAGPVADLFSLRGHESAQPLADGAVTLLWPS
jgi:hypothetical protein